MQIQIILKQQKNRYTLIQYFCWTISQLYFSYFFQSLQSIDFQQ